MNIKNLKYATTTILLALSWVWGYAQGIQKQEKINGLNAYTWYPQGYDTAKVKRWPLILFLPGAGETGTVASKLLTYGPSKFIADGKIRPNAVVISIQPTTQWPDQNVVNNALNSIIKGYKIDTTQIHITGISNGGNAVERFALMATMGKRIASVMPVSSTEVSSSYGGISSIKSYPFRWFFFCGNKDDQLGRQIELFTKLKLAGVDAQLQMDESGHSNFNTAYDPDFKMWGSGMNYYEWALLGQLDEFPPIDTADLQYCVGPADKIKKVIVLLKNGQYQEFDSSHVYIPTIKFP